ncbi:MAG: VWA domain-containing protein [Pseudomonadota bacterium]
MLVLDASGSMWGQIDGVNKIVIAREVVQSSLQTAVGDRPVGLIAYGHNRKGDCTDIEMLVPPGPGASAAVSAAVEAISPKGKTPLTDAVRRAAQAMRYKEDKATVVLVTDGLETCGADPCALARELEQAGLDFTAHVVGFGLSRSDGAAVSCLAEETGGRYFNADNKGELEVALSMTVARDIPPETETEAPPQVEPKHNLQINVQLTADSPPLERGQIDKLTIDLIRQPDGRTKLAGYEPVLAISVEEGDYLLRARYAGGQVELPVTIERFDVTHATIALDAGVVDFRAIPLSPDLIDPSIITWRLTHLDTGARQDRYEAELRSVFAPGRYEVSVILGRKDATAPPPVTLDITPGNVSEGEILLPHAALRLQTVSDTGTAHPDSFVRYALWSAKDDGSPDRFVIGANDTKRPLLALPGDYVLVVEDWGIAGGGKRKLVQPVSLQPGALVDRRILMPADVGLPMLAVGP